MASMQDCSVGFGVESTYKTGVTPTRWLEFVDENFDWNKNVKQGQGLRVGTRVARSGRRVVPSADGGGDVTVEAFSKSLGLLYQACMGNVTSTLVAGTTYQQVFTLGDTLPSWTIQKGIVEAGGTVDPITFPGCMVESFEINFTNQDICTIKAAFDIGDVTTATAYAAPSFVAANSGNLFHFANASLSLGGTLTPPTATALGSVASAAVANVRGGSLSVNNNLRDDRFNMAGTGRKSAPLVGLREITGKLDIEYTNTTFRDALLNETPLDLLLTYTGGALSTGVETLQIIVPEIKFDSPGLPTANGPDLITTSMSFTGLDNLVSTAPLWIVARTSDAVV